mmetsp:Transcript_48947/g.98486  ORF Transcript_48947/g.98486 Transcript_48947/m.98486 type:complete len:115 (-) Transcript_48947:461-805(-)
MDLWRSWLLFFGYGPKPTTECDICTHMRRIKLGCGNFKHHQNSSFFKIFQLLLEPIRSLHNKVIAEGETHDATWSCHPHTLVDSIEANMIWSESTDTDNSIKTVIRKIVLVGIS